MRPLPKLVNSALRLRQAASTYGFQLPPTEQGAGRAYAAALAAAPRRAPAAGKPLPPASPVRYPNPLAASAEGQLGIATSSAQPGWP